MPNDLAIIAPPIPVIPPFPTFSPIPPIPTGSGSVSTGSFSGTYGTYVSSSSNGPGPLCTDAGWGNQRVISSMAASVTGPLDGTANVATMASYGVNVPSLNLYTSKQALSLAVGAPIHGDVNNVLDGNSQLKTDLLAKGYKYDGTGISNCYNFMVGELGGSYNVNGRRSETVNSQIAFTLNTPLPAAVSSGNRDIYMGFSDIRCVNLLSLKLQVTYGSSSQTFGPYTSCNAFLTAFQNKDFDLGRLVDATQPLPIKLSLSLTPKPGYPGVYAKVLFADPLVRSAVDADAPSHLVRKTQNNVGADLDYRAVVRPLQASSAITDFGPGLVVMACAALFATIMAGGVWAPRKRSAHNS